MTRPIETTTEQLRRIVKDCGVLRTENERLQRERDALLEAASEVASWLCDEGYNDTTMYRRLEAAIALAEEG